MLAIGSILDFSGLIYVMAAMAVVALLVPAIVVRLGTAKLESAEGTGFGRALGAWLVTLLGVAPGLLFGVNTHPALAVLALAAPTVVLPQFYEGLGYGRAALLGLIAVGAAAGLIAIGLALFSS